VQQKIILEEKSNKRFFRKEILGWRIFRGNHSGMGDIGLVLFTTTNGMLRATIGIWKDKDNAAMNISTSGERLLFEEAYPFFKQYPGMIKENYHPA